MKARYKFASDDTFQLDKSTSSNVVALVNKYWKFVPADVSHPLTFMFLIFVPLKRKPKLLTCDTFQLDKSSESIAKSLKHPCNVVALPTSQLLTFNDVRLLQPLKIPYIYRASEVSQFDMSSKLASTVQLENTWFILTTFETSQFSNPFISVNLAQSANITLIFSH